MSPAVLRLFAIIFGLLSLFTIVGLIFRLTIKGEGGRTTVANMNARIAAWWIMAVMMACTRPSQNRNASVATISVAALIGPTRLRRYKARPAMPASSAL